MAPTLWNDSWMPNWRGIGAARDAALLANILTGVQT
jgi:hypothetical protein